MNGISLTPEQREFAADHHNLIYAFLNKKKLRDDDFYDIVVFGFLRAVKRYFEEPELNQYSFSTIAWRGMESKVKDFYKSQNRRNYYGRTISLDAILCNETSFSLEDTLFAPDPLMEQFETELLLHELASRVSRNQMAVVRMRTEGYNMREIAKNQRTTIEKVTELLNGVYQTVLAVCEGG